MNNLLKMNSNIIMREKDKMIFSAQKMQMYKFNDKGFNVIKVLYDKQEINKEDLFNIINKIDNYTEEEFNNIINKMKEYNIIILDKEQLQ